MSTMAKSDGSNPTDVLGALIDAQDEKLGLCVHCGFCLPACPTYQRLGDEADSPRGRLHLMRAVVEGRLNAGSDAFQVHIDRCLGCRACEPVCPSGVEYGLLLEGARHAAAQARRPPLMTRALLAVFGSSALRGSALLGGRVLRATGIPSLAARALPSGGLLGKAKLGMAMLAASAPPRIAPEATDRQQDGAGPPPTGHPPLTVALLSGCVQEGLFGRVNLATVRTLEANGYSVRTVVGQGCCGALHAHAGGIEAARNLARRNVDAFYPLIQDGGIDRIVVNAAGCGAAMSEYEHLLDSDPAYAERAKQVAARVADVTELLAERGPRPGAPLPLKVTYDSPCHLEHAQGVLAAPLAVLDSIPSLVRIPLPDSDACCGGAGIYGITHPDLGGRIGGDKVDAVVATGASVLATANPGCLMQIGAGLKMRGSDVAVAHPVEILDLSYERGGLYE